MSNEDKESKILAEAVDDTGHAGTEETEMTDGGTQHGGAQSAVEGVDSQMEENVKWEKETEEEDNGEKDKEEKEREREKKEKEKEKEEEQVEELALTIRKQAREDEEPLSKVLSLRKILGGDFFTADFMKRNVGVILLVVAFTMLYVANRYSCQSNLLEIDRLTKELQDSKYKALSSASELTEKCRETNVLERLKNNKDTLLKQSSQPPYIINVENK